MKKQLTNKIDEWALRFGTFEKFRSLNIKLNLIAKCVGYFVLTIDLSLQSTDLKEIYTIDCLFFFLNDQI